LSTSRNHKAYRTWMGLSKFNSAFSRPTASRSKCPSLPSMISTRSPGTRAIAENTRIETPKRIGTKLINLRITYLIINEIPWSSGLQKSAPWSARILRSTSNNGYARKPLASKLGMKGILSKPQPAGAEPFRHAPASQKPWAFARGVLHLSYLSIQACRK